MTVHETVEKCRTVVGQTVVEVDESVVAEVADRLREQGYFVTQIDATPVRDLDDLLDAIYHTCFFPDSFTFNEAVLMDYLISMAWLPANGYIFLFCDIGSMDDETFETFVSHFALAHRIKERRDGVPLKLLLPSHSRNAKATEIAEARIAAYVRGRELPD